jgi:hypothetical protein
VGADRIHGQGHCRRKAVIQGHNTSLPKYVLFQSVAELLKFAVRAWFEYRFGVLSRFSIRYDQIRRLPFATEVETHRTWSVLRCTEIQQDLRPICTEPRTG